MRLMKITAESGGGQLMLVADDAREVELLRGLTLGAAAVASFSESQPGALNHPCIVVEFRRPVSGAKEKP